MEYENSIHPIEFCRVCKLWTRSVAHANPSDCSYWSDNPDLVKIANAKLMERIYNGEILTGLKFAKNRWSAKDAGTLKVGRKNEFCIL